MDSQKPGLLTAVESETTTNKITQVLKDAILTGVLRPGDTLVERQLSLDLGVSKTPVREALISLAASGLVHYMANRRVTVAMLSNEEIREIYQLRLLLEPWATGETARLQPKENIDRAREILQTSHQITKDFSGRDEEYAELSKINRMFHQALYSGCANVLVIKKMDELQDLTSLAISNVLWRKWPTWSVELEDHTQILDAVVSGNATEAEERSRQHIKRTLDHLDK